MADRLLNRDALVTVDIPGSEGAAVTLSTFDPYGVAVLIDEPATPIGDIRHQYTLLADVLTTPGLWTNVWFTGTKTVRQEFTVGRPDMAALTKYDLRNQIASRVSEIEHGTITAAEDSIISDSSLIGGADEFVGWWVVPHPSSPDAGRFFRVVGFNGSGLELSDSFISPPSRGDEYTLMRLNPREVDKAMRLSIAELSPLSRIEVFYSSIAAGEDRGLVPAGITHVAAIYSADGKLTPASWEMTSGRQFLVTGLGEATISLTGLRDASFPVWDDSLIETDEATTVARSALHLHANRAAGPAIDNEEHLRRQLAAQDEYERSKRNTVGRIPPGTRSVVE